ncbi:hypothetical protein NKG05_24610 [Oerskovia sp. M15]
MREFTAQDFAARTARAAAQARDAGLAGCWSPRPGHDLLHRVHPTAMTERITLLVVPAEGEASVVVPVLERPDLDLAPGPPPCTSPRGPTAPTSTPSPPTSSTRPGTTRSPTRPGPCTCWGSSARCRARRTPR